MKDRLNLNELAEVVNDEKSFRRLASVISFALIFGSCLFTPIFLNFTPDNLSDSVTIVLAFMPLLILILVIMGEHAVTNFLTYRRAVKRVKEATHFEMPNRSMHIILMSAWYMFSGAVVLIVAMTVFRNFFIGFGLYMVFMLRENIIMIWANRPFRRGNMEGAYKRLQLLKRIYRKNPLLAAIEATIFIQQGKLKEGELAYRDALAKAQLTANTLVISVALNDLGYFFVFMERYEESLPLLEMGLRISPQLGPIYDSLALYYVEQNIYPERAIELTERALEYHKDKLGRNIVIATMARALAQMGIQDEANAKLNEAIESAEKLNNKLALTEIFRQAGHIRLLQGEVEHARLFFQRAILNGETSIYAIAAQRDLNSIIEKAA